jgi:hypothetical protein
MTDLFALGYTEKDVKCFVLVFNDYSCREVYGTDGVDAVRRLNLDYSEMKNINHFFEKGNIHNRGEIKLASGPENVWLERRKLTRG